MLEKIEKNFLRKSFKKKPFQVYILNWEEANEAKLLEMNALLACKQQQHAKT